MRKPFLCNFAKCYYLQVKYNYSINNLIFTYGTTNFLLETTKKNLRPKVCPVTLEISTKYCRALYITFAVTNRLPSHSVYKKACLKYVDLRYMLHNMCPFLYNRRFRKYWIGSIEVLCKFGFVYQYETEINSLDEAKYL